MFQFSVIIPTFNDFQGVSYCLDAILAQQRDDIEIIIVDDASTDDSSYVADRYQRVHENIVFVRNEENMGPGGSRNVGIRAASGEYIIFVDSDDLLADASLGKMSEFISTGSTADMIQAKWSWDDINISNKVLFDNQDIIKSRDPRDLIDYVMEINYFHNVCWSYIYRRMFLVERGIEFQHAMVGEDIDFVTKCLCSAESIAYFNEEFYIHRGPGRLSMSIDLKSNMGFINLINSLTAFLKGADPLDDSRYNFIVSRIKYIWGSFGVRISHNSDENILQLDAFLATVAQKNPSMMSGLKELGIVTDCRSGCTLMNLKRDVCSSVLELVTDKSADTIFVFCASIYSLTVCTILERNGYAIAGILDNSPELAGDSIGGFTIDSPDILATATGVEGDRLVIVCNLHDRTFNIICKQLSDLGIDRNHVIHYRGMVS